MTRIRPHSPSRRPIAGRLRRRRFALRRGLSVIIVLGLLAITLALSYAMVRTQITSVQIQSNASRKDEARQAAHTGMLIGLRRIHQADWSGVDTVIQGQLGDHVSYSVSYATGDPALTAGDPDYAEYPYRVTLTSKGAAADPANPDAVATHQIRVVVQLVRRRLANPPSSWANLQNYTVTHWSADPTYVQIPVRMEGPVLFRGPLEFCEEYPEHSDAKQRYLEDLEKMRQAGLGDYRPFNDTVSYPQNILEVLLQQLLSTVLNLPILDVPLGGSAPFSHPGAVLSYQLYRGGKMYSVPTVQSQYGSNLSNVALGPDPIGNPLGLFPSEGALHLKDNVDIQGVLIGFGSQPDFHVNGINVHLRAVDLPPLDGAAGRVQLPVVIGPDDFWVQTTSQGSLTGMVLVWDDFEFSRGSASTAFDFRGRLAAGQVKLLGRTTWDVGYSAWSQYYDDFRAQLGDASSIDYFPLWLQAAHGMAAKPLLTIKPDSAGVSYHWHNWSQPVFQPHPDDEGLRWDLIHWQELN